MCYSKTPKNQTYCICCDFATKSMVIIVWNKISTVYMLFMSLLDIQVSDFRATNHNCTAAFMSPYGKKRTVRNIVK